MGKEDVGTYNPAKLRERVLDQNLILQNRPSGVQRHAVGSCYVAEGPPFGSCLRLQLPVPRTDLSAGTRRKSLQAAAGKFVGLGWVVRGNTSLFQNDSWFAVLGDFMRRKEFKGVRNIIYLPTVQYFLYIPRCRHMFNDGTNLSLFVIVKRGRRWRRIGTYLYSSFDI